MVVDGRRWTRRIDDLLESQLNKNPHLIHHKKQVVEGKKKDIRRERERERVEEI